LGRTPSSPVHDMQKLGECAPAASSSNGVC
jgi:hypothetical protein